MSIRGPTPAWFRLRAQNQAPRPRIAPIGADGASIGVPLLGDRLHRGIRLDAHFPYVFVDYLNRLNEYPESKIDYRDPTLAIPYAMPALVFLAVVALAIALVRPTPARPTVVLLCVSAVPFTLAMLMAIAVTQRYTGDFCPFLIAMGAVGVSLLDGLESRVRIACVAVLMTSVGVGTIVEAAMTLHTQRAIVWGVPAGVQQQYRTWQHRIDAWFGVDKKTANTPTP